jgi:DNA repair protein RecO (recombination protein O)
MKNQIKTTGIILRRMNFHEADQIVTVLTRSEGRLSFLAKGSRKLSSKFCGKLELTSEINLEGHEGRSLHYLKEAEVLRHRSETNLKEKGILFFMAEAVNRLVPEGQPLEEVYSLLSQSLQKMEEEITRKELILYAFLIKLLTELGFMAAWDHCPDTKQKLDLERPVYLSEEGNPTHHYTPLSRPLSPTLIKWVNFMQKYPLDEILKVKPSPEIQNEAWSILSDHLKRLLPSPLKSEAFLGRV